MPGTFTFEDFLQSLEKVQRMGPIKDLIGSVPGMARYSDLQNPDQELKRIRAIIQSMTSTERANHCPMTPSMVRRISRGSGAPEPLIEDLIVQFESMRTELSRLK